MKKPHRYHALWVRISQVVGAGSALALGAGCGAQSTSSTDRSQEGFSAQDSENDEVDDDTSDDDTTSEDDTASTGPVNQLPDPMLPAETPATPPDVIPIPPPGPVEAPEQPGVMCEFGQAQEFCLSRAAMEGQARYGTGQIALDPPRSEEEVAAGFDENGCMRHDWVATSCCNAALQPGVPQSNEECCYIACEGACCGRAFVLDGEAVLADAVPREDWLFEAMGLEVNRVKPKQASELAEAWTQDALMEHASIASFARFSLDLMALGAPPSLLEEAQRAALDEVDHARRCFRIASELGGSARGPGVLPVAPMGGRDLKTAAVAAVHEGCVGETLAAGVAQAQADVTPAGPIAETLRKIAADELRHAELAWRFVAWAIRVGGQAVGAAVRDAFSEALAMPVEAPLLASSLPEAVANRWGRLTAEQWRTAAEEVRAQVLRPVVRSLLGDQLLERTARVAQAEPAA